MSADLPGAILFACSQNAIRSPMAAAIMKHYFGHRVYVDSCGVRAGERDEFVQQVLDEIGMDASRHTSKSFDDLEDSSFDLVISLSPEAHHKAMEMTRTMAIDVEYWPTIDPSLICRQPRTDPRWIPRLPGCAAQAHQPAVRRSRIAKRIALSVRTAGQGRRIWCT
jgi:protein-tyrosine-phosphatase